MVKYNWSIYDIEARMSRLYILLQKETDPKKRLLIEADLRNLKKYFDDQYYHEVYNQKKLLTRYENRKNECSQIEFLKDDFGEFADLTTGFPTAPEISNVSLSKDDILELTHDFYKTLNHYFFRRFKKNFAQRYDHIAFIENSKEKFKGVALSILSLKETFIDIHRDYTLTDVITVIHEYMHATSMVINPYHFLDNKYIYSELDTAFIELLAADYLNGIFKGNTGPALKASNHAERINDVRNVIDTFKIIGFEERLGCDFDDNSELKNAAQKTCNLSGKMLEDMLTIGDFQPEIYITGYIFAIELYDLYKRDKDLALFFLRSIIEMRCYTYEDYYRQLKKFNLYPNNHMSEYHQELQSDVIRLERLRKEKSEM